jgi:hypothetical protein
LAVALGASFLSRIYSMDGQLALGLGLGILGISIPITALILTAIPRRDHHAARAAESVVRDQDRVRGVQIAAAAGEETMAGVKVHLANIDGRLERIEKKIYE